MVTEDDVNQLHYMGCPLYNIELLVIHFVIFFEKN